MPRQICYRKDQQQHVLPANALLPAHQGMLITRGLQEWACLLSLDTSFATAQRLLGWLTEDAAVLGTTTVREGVRTHGAALRAAEAAEVARWAADPKRSQCVPQWVPATPPRRRAAWLPALEAAVTAALAAASPTPPEGVTRADWERLLEVRREEAAAAQPAAPVGALRRLGPRVAPGQVVVSPDEVLVRRPQRRTWLELRTARVATAAGYRYLSGTGEAFLAQLELVLGVCAGSQGWVTLLADGGRWIAAFFRERLGGVAQAELLLDWYHLKRKCYVFASHLGRNRQARRALLAQLLRSLWVGDVATAVADLEAYRPQTCHEEKLDELLGYLRERAGTIPNYRERRRQRQYLGSGAVEKANDLLIARRQKRKGMHWSEEGSDSLAALKTLLLNGGWDQYWQTGEVLPLVACPSGSAR